jgi:hypothetical protein
MWDRLFTGCSIATMDPAVPGPFGAIEDGAIAVQDGRIVRIGRRVEMAGMRAHARESLGGAWVTPGLVDCHTHLVFGGNRAAEFEQRLGGASYEEIARAGGGIMSTVKATRGSSSGELIASGRERLRALMKSGVTTVEIKTGYGLDTATELRLLNAIKALAASEPVRIVPTLLALHALPPEYADRRADYVQMVVDEMLPAAAGSVGADRCLSGADRLYSRRGRDAVQGGEPAWPQGQAARRPAQQWRRRGPCGAVSARCRPIISSMSTRRAWPPWPRQAPSRCCCPVPTIRCRRLPRHRSSCSAGMACRWRSAPTATPALPPPFPRP